MLTDTSAYHSAATLSEMVCQRPSHRLRVKQDMPCLEEDALKAHLKGRENLGLHHHTIEENNTYLILILKSFLRFLLF